MDFMTPTLRARASVDSSNNFGKRHLKRNALVDRSQQELTSEFSIPKVLR
jgi:hypothetical protein